MSVERNRNLPDIIGLVDAGLTYAAVARVFGLTRERVRQLALKYGCQPAPAPDWMPVAEVARDLGVDAELLSARLRKAGLAFQEKKGSPALVHRDNLETVWRLYSCRQCGRRLPKRHSVFCSRECWQLYWQRGEGYARSQRRNWQRFETEKKGARHTPGEVP